MSQSNHPNLRCWNCGADLADLPAPISRHDHCPKCFEALHNCRSCRHYAPQAPGACTEDQADSPNNKENANFCEWFAPSSDTSSTPAADRNDDARARLDDLFSKD